MKGFDDQKSPTANTRYLMLYVDNLKDEGSFQLTAYPSRLLWPDGQVLKNLEFNMELQHKLNQALVYLSTDPLVMFQQLLPITKEIIDTIINYPRVFYLEHAYSTLSFPFMETKPVPLGIWAQLWKLNNAVFTCTECGGQVQIIQCSRSLGDGISRGFCSSCFKWMKSSGTDCWNLAFEALKLLPLSSVKPYRFDQGMKVILERTGRI
jgi:hypothetical protein